MKIDDANAKLAGPLSAQQAEAQIQTQRGPTTKSAMSAHASNIVSISAATRSLSATPPAEAPIDAARVDEIRAAIAAGSFTVNPDKIADSLIASVRELLSGKK